MISLSSVFSSWKSCFPIVEPPRMVCYLLYLSSPPPTFKNLCPFDLLSGRFLQFYLLLFILILKFLPSCFLVSKSSLHDWFLNPYLQHLGLWYHKYLGLFLLFFKKSFLYNLSVLQVAF